MDGSKEQPKVTAGLDLGDKYSYLCLIDTLSGEVIEEGRLHTSPEALRRRFRALAARSHRGWNPLALGEQGARGVWPRGPGCQCPQTEAHLRQQTQNRRDRRRKPGSPGTPRSEALVPVKAPGRRCPGPSGLNPLPPGASRLPHAACKPRP
jgi:hypothetical protein